MRNDFHEGAFLAHSAKGTSWKSTKYLKKVPLGNGRYYYIYTQAQLNAWNKRHSSGSSNNTPTNVLSNNERNKRMTTAVSSGRSLDNIIRNGMVAKGNTLAEKTANLKKNIADGEEAIKKALASSESSSSKKGSGSGSSGSSKKSKSGSSGKSKSGSSGKSKSGSSGKSAKEKTAKEKSGSSKAAKEKTTKEKTTTKKEAKAVNNTPITMDSLKKILGKEDKDISSFKGTAAEFKKNLLKKYKDGAFGYLSAGGKVYKFTIQNGNVILQDFDTDKEVSFDQYLKDAKDFKEFKSNTKKK